jgi:hypothetical protein
LVLERLKQEPLCLKGKCALGHKSSKECVALHCRNSSRNHKLKLVVIGKAKKP